VVVGGLGFGRSQRIVTRTGWEAIPLATTTSVLAPAGVVLGTMNWVDKRRLARSRPTSSGSFARG